MSARNDYRNYWLKKISEFNSLHLVVRDKETHERLNNAMEEIFSVVRIAAMEIVDSVDIEQVG